MIIKLDTLGEHEYVFNKVTNITSNITLAQIFALTKISQHFRI